MIVVGRKALRQIMQNRGMYASLGITDTDIWSDVPMTHKVVGLDFCLIPSEIMEAFSEQSVKSGVAVAEDLLAIKMSHFCYDIFWKKHKQDILLLNKITEGRYNKHLYSLLKEHWKQEFGNKDFLSLYRTKDQFFDDFVPKQHEHDYLHELVAFPAQPMYISCLKEGHDVYIDSEKWNLLYFGQKVRMMKEEIAVIALERWLIPSLTKKSNQFTIQQSWIRSVHKTVTRLTKGEFSCFIAENIEEFLNPLEKEMLHTLEVLNLKEMYMTNKINFDNFIEMVGEILVEQGFTPKWEEEWRKYDILHGDFPKNSRVKLIEQEGGEGQGESAHTILKVDNTYYFIDYAYFSHDGFDYSYATVRVVSPKQKTITVYE